MNEQELKASQLAIDSKKIEIEFKKLELEHKKIELEQNKFLLEKTKIAHSRWWHEDALVHNRLTWLLHSQTVLIASYGYFYSKQNEKSTNQTTNLSITQHEPSNQNNKIDTSRHTGTALIVAPAEANKTVASQANNGIIEIIPWVGVSICLCILAGIHAARTAQLILKSQYKKDDITVGVSNTTTDGGMFTSLIIPLLFIFGWGWIYWGLIGSVFSILFGMTALCIATKKHYKNNQELLDTDSKIFYFLRNFCKASSKNKVIQSGTKPPEKR